MRDNYPDGAANDPNAPYNEKRSRDMIPWESTEHCDCGYCGRESVYVNEDGNCKDCYEDHVPKYYEDEEDETPREDDI